MQRNKIPRAALIKYVIWVVGLPLGLLLTAWIGIAIGYSLIGGFPLSEGFSSQAWRHMYQLVFG